ncbi:Protein-disulfide isomerase [Pseudooceanicola antarcticus]|uniref:Disulfide bond formation protein DsbA n=1 Tax=Pseudooceanicola antarcticus TaxID=1247613 RepID=A0A285J100_9RHOB|nr:DsbA family protein [Pseudooceanicola antarcticus]PJE29922.1 disulfide bond formation protein DsbA [Pseudooceanicola antarcticus]SNY53888.1 Protein-disulfide isomerase [Pseudooceanicola antarcticus]
MSSLRPILTTAVVTAALTGAAFYAIDKMPTEPELNQAAEASAPGLTPSERESFRTEVRDYLMEHPEVLLEAIQVLEDRQAVEAAEAEVAMVRDNAEALFDDGFSWVGGNPEGDITLVEFMDYRCGYCRKAFEDVEELVATDGNIRFVLKEFPILGEESLAASQLAIATQLAAGDEAYKQMHDALMVHSGGFDEVSVRRLLSSLGIEEEPVIAMLGSPEVAEVINANRALAQKLEITGTPTFVLPETLLRGYVPLAGMRSIVADLRAE